MYTHEDAMRPILEILQDGMVRSRREISNAVADHFGVTEEDRAILLPSGSIHLYHSRAGWGLTFLIKAGEIERPKRGHYRITEAGRATLDSGVARIDDAFLRAKSESFLEWVTESAADRNRTNSPSSPTLDESHPTTTSQHTPEELLASAHGTLQRELASEILETIGSCSPRFFEELVVRLLVKMGYGGSFADAANSVGRSRDGGIDGIIKEDRLGLDAIFIQAKRWQNNVGRPEVQAFVGALTGHRAKKGVFITTSRFTREAMDYIQNLEAKVVLIDGATLAEYMIEVNLGVSSIQTFEVKQLDTDFFEE